MPSPEQQRKGKYCLIIADRKGEGSFAGPDARDTIYSDEPFPRITRGDYVSPGPIFISYRVEHVVLTFSDDPRSPVMTTYLFLDETSE